MDYDAPLAEGSVSFDLPLGRHRVRVLDLPTTWSPFVARHYHPFAEAMSQDPADLTIRCVEALGADEIPIERPGELPVLEFTPLPTGVMQLRSHWQRGWIDAARGQAEVTFTSRQALRVRVSLENFLRIACQAVLVRREAFLLHSAGIIDQDSCLLFFGPHESGKSSLAELASPRPVLSDDLVMIDLSGPRPSAVAVPFFGAYEPTLRVRGSYPVSLVCRMARDPGGGLRKLASVPAIAALHANMPFANDLGLDPGALSQLAARLVQSAKTYEWCEPDYARLWPAIDRLG